MPRREEPTIVACSMIVSGLRIFDIRNPVKPVEVGYYNAPVLPGVDFVKNGAFAMSAPAFAADRDEIWYTDGNSGFYSLRLTGAAKAALDNTSPVPTGAAGSPVTVAGPPAAGPPAAGPPAAGPPAAGPRAGVLAATGLPAGLPWATLAALLLGAAALRRRHQVQ